MLLVFAFCCLRRLPLFYLERYHREIQGNLASLNGCSDEDLLSIDKIDNKMKSMKCDKSQIIGDYVKKMMKSRKTDLLRMN